MARPGSPRRITRRRLLIATVGGSAAAMLAACVGGAPAPGSLSTAPTVASSAGVGRLSPTPAPPSDVASLSSTTGSVVVPDLSPGRYFVSAMAINGYGESVGKALYLLSNEIAVEIR